MPSNSLDQLVQWLLAMPSHEVQVTVSAGVVTQVLPYSRDRVGIKFPAAHGYNAYYSTDPGVALAGGFPVNNAIQGLDFWAFQSGDIVQRAWYVITDSGPIIMSILEVFLPGGIRQ